MKKISCLIIDDEPPAQVVLKKYIEQVERLKLAGICNSAVEAISILQTEPIDLLFLDIQMPGLLGTNLIRTLNNPPKVIFTTAFRKFAVEGFELNAVDYLLKPISFERFLMAVNKIFQLNLQPVAGTHLLTEPDPESNYPFFYVRSDRKKIKVLFDDILYVESIKNYIKIVTNSKTIITRQSISSLEQMLPMGAFLRIHRSYIIALNKIESFSGELVQIGKTELPIGRLFKHDVNMQLNK